MNRSALALLLCAAAPLLAAGEPDQPRKVVAIEVRGNIRVPTATVLSLIHSKVGQPFSQETWDADWHRLKRTGLFEHVRTTVPLGWPGGQKLVIDLTEKPACEDLVVKGVEDGAAEKIREACAGFIGALDTPVVRKSIVAAVKDLHGPAAEVELTAVCLRTHKQQIAGEEQEVPDAVEVVIAVR